MKQLKKLLVYVLALAMLLSLCGCGQSDSPEDVELFFPIVVSDDGVASWDPVDGAVEYQYSLVDAWSISIESGTTKDTSITLSEGMSVHVQAVFRDGRTTSWMTSDYFDPNHTVVLRNISDYIDTDFDLKWEDVASYELLSNIDYASVTTAPDGTVCFDAASPNGGVMRFVGHGVTLAQGSITFEPGGRIVALDAIGRVCSVGATVTEPGDSGNFVNFIGGLSFTDKTSLESEEELFITPGNGFPALESVDAVSCRTSLMHYQPNFIGFGSMDLNVDSFTVSELLIYYDEATFTTGLRKMLLNYDMYGTYMAGDQYNESKEVYDSAAKIYDFYLLLVPDILNELNRFEPEALCDDLDTALMLSLSDIDDSRFSIGDLKDADGNVLDKQTARLETGATVEVTLGDYTVDMELPMIERYQGAQTLHDLAPYNNAFAQGSVNALVIPIYWQDQTKQATEETLSALSAALGRVQDAQGTETDFSQNREESFSLSEYYDICTYGQYRISSFVTQWYAAPYDFADKETTNVLTDTIFMDELYQWLMQTYDGMDWSRFDADADGFFDAIILVNAGVRSGNEILMGSYSHAVMLSPGYTGEGAGTQSQPKIKNFISMNTQYLADNTLIHEFAHTFGIVDYYDVTYSGIDAVGHYDLQSASAGDWNAFSKYAAGWIEPEVISGLEHGQSLDITIGSLAKSGDAIVIPAADSDFDGPFGEYLIVDLLTDEGVNQYDAASFNLSGVAGVRISHVNATMEKRVLTGNSGTQYPIGTIHYPNTYNEQGTYLLEVIQSSKTNTFTTLDSARTNLSAEDLFFDGDVFRAEDYTAFLSNGLMDNGQEFGYTIEIVRINCDASGEYTAQLRITRS